MKKVIVTSISCLLLASSLLGSQKLEFKERLYDSVFKKAQSGDAASEFALGEIYYLGFLGEKDYEKAVEWFKKAAVQGHKKAQYNLGYIYFVGKGGFQDYKESFKWFESSSTDPKAARYLAHMYRDGLGVKADSKLAMKWYRKAADFGYPDAQFTLANMLLESGDNEEALRYLQKSAMQSYSDAQYQLGNMYKNGNIVEKNELKGARLIKKAMENGYNATH